MSGLRDYQQDAVDAVYSGWKDGLLRPAIVLPTGTGKTRTFSEILTQCAADGGRALAINHRDFLGDQITRTCRAVAPDIPVGRVQGPRNETRRPITVASIGSLSPERIAKLLPRGERYDVIVCDEAHRAAAPSWVRALGLLGSFESVPTLGVTATMSRGGKYKLGDVWEEVVYERDTAWAIGQGWLVEPRGRVVVGEHLDLNKVKTNSKGDYADGELGEMVAQDVEHIVDAWCKNARRPDGTWRRTAAFWPTIESSHTAAEVFRAHRCDDHPDGMQVGEVYGSTPAKVRGDTDKGTGIYGDLAAGRIRVMCSVMVTTEGWDCPPVDCILMARPTKLQHLYIQIVGRGLRPSPATGKLDCLVLDVVGASRTQSLVSLIDLHKTAKVNSDELDALPCEDCGQVECECPPAEVGERDPDGGRRRLQGPASYEDVDMFAGSRCRWLWTRQGVRCLPAGERTFLLWPDFPELAEGAKGDERTTWSVASVISAPWKHERVEWLDDDQGHTLAAARELAESAALALDPTVASRDAGWRRARRSPSEKMLKLARSYRIANPEQYTAGALSDEISIEFATLRLAQGGYR